MAETGIFTLRTAKDLFGRLEHDFGRVKRNPTDSFAAFDFFVTAPSLGMDGENQDVGSPLSQLKKLDLRLILESNRENYD